MTFLLLAITTFALCYLAADARIFGADTTAWNDVYGEHPPSEDDERWVQGLGILKLRQWLLRWRLVREHLSCYFCMGVWAGPLAHLLLWSLYDLQASQSGWTSATYVLQHPNTAYGWSLGLLCAFLWGSASSYFLNAVLQRIEGV